MTAVRAFITGVVTIATATLVSCSAMPSGSGNPQTAAPAQTSLAGMLPGAPSVLRSPAATATAEVTSTPIPQATPTAVPVPTGYIVDIAPGLNPTWSAADAASSAMRSLLVEQRSIGKVLAEPRILSVAAMRGRDVPDEFGGPDTERGGQVVWVVDCQGSFIQQSFITAPWMGTRGYFVYDDAGAGIGFGSSLTISPSGAPTFDSPYLSRAEAIDRAATYLGVDAYEVWGAAPGYFNDVYAGLGHSRTYNPLSPSDSPVDPDLAVWGVEFKITGEICPPGGTECETRQVLRSIFIDEMSGDLVWQSTYGPNPQGPFPTPFN